MKTRCNASSSQEKKVSYGESPNLESPDQVHFIPESLLGRQDPRLQNVPARIPAGAAVVYELPSPP